MDNILDLPARLAHALIALALIVAALGGTKGPPSSPTAQLAFPFVEQRRVSRGHPYLRKAAAKYVSLATGYKPHLASGEKVA